MILSSNFRERAHILKQNLHRKKMSLLFIKWDFLPCIKWDGVIPEDELQ